MSISAADSGCGGVDAIRRSNAPRNTSKGCATSLGIKPLTRSADNEPSKGMRYVTSSPLAAASDSAAATNFAGAALGGGGGGGGGALAPSTGAAVAAAAAAAAVDMDSVTSASTSTARLASVSAPLGGDAMDATRGSDWS